MTNQARFSQMKFPNISVHLNDGSEVNSLNNRENPLVSIIINIFKIKMIPNGSLNIMK
jgi:hypothetical protein